VEFLRLVTSIDRQGHSSANFPNLGSLRYRLDFNSTSHLNNSLDTSYNSILTDNHRLQIMEDLDNCPFMRLPTELRLLIYSYALVDTPAITIGSAMLVGSHPDIVHRL
jgi:hypothetical protein